MTRTKLPLQPVGASEQDVLMARRRSRKVGIPSGEWDLLDVSLILLQWKGLRLLPWRNFTTACASLNTIKTI